MKRSLLLSLLLFFLSLGLAGTEMLAVAGTPAQTAEEDAASEEREEQADTHRDALKQMALERFYALPEGDPLKAVLGRVLGEGTVPAPEQSPVGGGLHAFRPDAWDAIHSLQRGHQGLFSAVKTIDARAAAAMQEAQRLSDNFVSPPAVKVSAAAK